MSRLQAEFQRLYLGGSRGLVLELTQPADWSSLSLVWRGVQADLGLPAPAISVNGVDGLQLWFSLAEPVAEALGQAFLQGLWHRYLPDLPMVCLALLTADLPTVPALVAPPDQWSAFVSADLAPLFSETPWLDVPPGEDGQAQLLAGLSSISAQQFTQALTQLAPAVQAVAAPLPAQQVPVPASAQAGEPWPGQDPQRFLWAVMNDDGAPLALRVEAAKALLPYSAAGAGAGPAERR